MAGTLNESHERGFQQAVAALFDEAMTGVGKNAAAKRKRELLLMDPDAAFGSVRKALDAAPDDFYMQRALALFYLDMSPGVFKQHAAVVTSPFPGKSEGAPKGAVNEWFTEVLRHKHKAVLDVKPKRISRDLEAGRPFIVDESGKIVADAHINSVSAEDMALVLSLGGLLRILHLEVALAMPWSSPRERQPWATGRRRMLHARITALHQALSDAVDQDAMANVPAD